MQECSCISVMCLKSECCGVWEKVRLLDGVLTLFCKHTSMHGALCELWPYGHGASQTPNPQVRAFLEWSSGRNCSRKHRNLNTRTATRLTMRPSRGHLGTLSSRYGTRTYARTDRCMLLLSPAPYVLFPHSSLVFAYTWPCSDFPDAVAQKSPRSPRYLVARTGNTVIS